MKEQLLRQTIAHFCKKYANKEKLLVAVSGGGDSIALFYLLLFNNIHFEVAHVNHGWRQESIEETLYVKELCQKHDIYFNFLQSSPSRSNSLEEEAREIRLDFFKQICMDRNCCAVVTAHHANDRAETVLKRIFEGAPLWKIKSFSEKMEFEGLVVLRPLLNIESSLLKLFLKNNNIKSFEDTTNKDPKYSRARIRHSILPFLKESFGKDIVPPLNSLAKESELLADFLDEEFNNYKDNIFQDTTRLGIDMTKSHKSVFMQYSILKSFFYYANVDMSKKFLEQIIDHINTNKNKKIELRIKEKRLVIDGKKIYIIL